MKTLSPCLLIFYIPRILCQSFFIIMRLKLWFSLDYLCLSLLVLSLTLKVNFIIDSFVTFMGVLN